MLRFRTECVALCNLMLRLRHDVTQCQWKLSITLASIYVFLNFTVSYGETLDLGIMMQSKKES